MISIYREHQTWPTQQIRGKTWVFRGEVTTNTLHNDSDKYTEKDQKTPLFRTIKFQLQAALGAKFENMFGNLFNSVSYFGIFCSLVNILENVDKAAEHRECCQHSRFLLLR
jgi:hypothetical protein